MILHKSPDIFEELIQATAKRFSIPELYVEKDYWVTRALKRLCESDYSDKIVFKGGTSLSKAFKLIQRFSEDIDLAIICGQLSGNQKSKLLKEASLKIAEDLTYVPKHPLESKHGSFRKTAHKYPRIVRSEDFGKIEEVIILELNSFADPHPSEDLPISTLVHDVLIDSSRKDLVTEYELEPFEIKVLGVRRTLCEKIMGLISYGYLDNHINVFQSKIRHFYDISMILRIGEFREFLASSEFSSMFNLVRKSDLSVFPASAKWLLLPAHESIVFAQFKEIWSEIRGVFHGGFSEMLYDDDLPDDKEVFEAISLIRNSLEILENTRN